MSKKILKRTKVPHLNIIKLKVESKVEKNKKKLAYYDSIIEEINLID